MPFSIEGADLVTIGLLVLLEAALSADNALVLAVLVLPLPKRQQKKALRYGIVGAFAFRVLATLFAVHLIHMDWVKLLGGLYLLYLPFKHFSQHGSGGGDSHPLAKTLFGLSLFWACVTASLPDHRREDGDAPLPFHHVALELEPLPKSCDKRCVWALRGGKPPSPLPLCTTIRKP